MFIHICKQKAEKLRILDCFNPEGDIFMKRMRIIFASGNGYLPEFSGGVQSSTDQLVRQCQAIGHHSWVLAALFGAGVGGFFARLKLKMSRSGIATDSNLGYPVIRAWTPWAVVPQVMRKVKPDVVLVQCQGSVKIGKAFIEHDVPLVLYFRNVEFHELDGDPTDLPGALFIANSEFTAAAYRARFGIESTVIPPLIDRDLYRTETSREFVTFINLDPKKGLAKALEIAAACQEIRFLFVESWTLSAERWIEIKHLVERLPNVVLHRRVKDMRQIFARTRILLAPSQWEEAWGRVASEAHCSGIPVLGSDRGGLPEAIGPGGVVLDYDAPIHSWVVALRNLWSNAEYYRRYSEAALAYMDRPEMDPARQFDKFLSVLSQAAHRSHEVQ